MAPLDVAGKYTKEEKLEKVRKILREVGLSDKYLEKYPHEMSGGQRQRVVIARALINDPELVICDEPVSALDVSVRSQVLNLLKDLHKERNLTYIFISHDLSVVEYLCDKVSGHVFGAHHGICRKEGALWETSSPVYKSIAVSDSGSGYPREADEVILQGELPSPLNHRQDVCSVQDVRWRQRNADKAVRN